MSKDLERDLGLPSVLAISIGAMVGSGIFILPGLALKMAGPAVILAYLLAGLLVLPAALSKSEMATAMPEAGGTYLYIERGMGPLLGTIAGVGTWFSLTFKGALALVGGAPYLVLLFDLPVRPVAIATGVILILVNLVGVKQTGRLQVVIVTVMLAALTWFVAGSATAVDSVRYEPFFDGGLGGLLAATGFVFVSYAGVTKIASVAEEIEHPDRNIPIGILGSLVFTTLLYVALVVVMVGVVPAAELGGSNIPMAIAADRTLASAGIAAIVIAALIALVSTANAGILSSSRYPLAMSRDSLAPPTLGAVSQRFNTPVQAITLTGAVLLVMVAFVPIDEIAKLASAFKILVFVLVNIALIAFREADLPQYDPSFESPLYPLPQLVGIIGGLVLIPLMGGLALAGAALIVVGSLVWYLTYVRRRGDVEREGAAVDAIRQRLGRQVVAETETAVTEQTPYDVLVAVTERTAPERETTLLRVASAIALARNGTVQVSRFDEVPDQTPLGIARDRQTPGDRSFEARMRDATVDADVPTEFEEIVSHDTKHAIVNHAERLGVDAVILERRGELIHTRLFGSDIDWIKRHAPCDVIEIEDRGIDDVETVSVVSDRGPYDATKVILADALAAAAGASVELLFAVEPAAPDQRRETIQAYLTELEDQFSVPVTSRLVPASDRAGGLIEASRETDLVVISAGTRGLRGAVFGRPSDRIIEAIDRTAVVVYAGTTRPSWIRRFLENRVF
jgi:amino acid transporter/nucleotide-binding universal stress UspA family protein